MCLLGLWWKGRRAGLLENSSSALHVAFRVYHHGYPVKTPPPCPLPVLQHFAAANLDPAANQWNKVRKPCAVIAPMYLPAVCRLDLLLAAPPLCWAVLQA